MIDAECPSCHHDGPHHVHFDDGEEVTAECACCGTYFLQIL